MLRQARDSGEFVAASMAAVMIAGLIYIGVLLLVDSDKPEDTHFVEGAINLAQPQKDEPIEPLREREVKEVQPPKKLPKTFTNKPKTRTSKPVMNINMPSFSPDMHPGLTGDFSIPTGELGGVGFNMDEVDEVPQALRHVPPEYPYTAKRNRIEGEVVVRMLVTSQGLPVNLSIHSSTPAGVFDKAALNAAKRWKFRPGHYHGQAVDTWVLLPFNFELTR